MVDAIRDCAKQVLVKRGEPALNAHLIKSGCVKLVDTVKGKRVTALVTNQLACLVDHVS